MITNRHHPNSPGNLDSPEVSNARRETLRSRPVLRRIYQDWYNQLISCIPSGSGEVLEIGSGGGFLQDLLPKVIRSDFLPLDEIDVQFNACTSLPFGNASLKAILGLNVFHHLFAPRRFLQEVERCLRPGGVLALIDPWVNPWSRFIFRTFHHEPFEPEAQAWEFASTGPLSGANGALAHVIFSRDLSSFAEEFPNLQLVRQRPLTPFSYALSGGFSHSEFLPEILFEPLMYLEKQFHPVCRHFGMFAVNVLRRTPNIVGSISPTSARSTEALAARLSREKEHGKRLAVEAVEVAWGWGTPAGEQRADRRALLIEDAAELNSSKKILEIGCGSGEFTERWAMKAEHLLAIDVSPELLSLAQRRLSGSRNTAFLCTILEDLNIGSDRFDAIIGSSVLHHLDLRRSLPKLFSLLRHGGMLAFAEPNYLNPQVFLERFCRHLRWFDYVSPDETAFFRPFLKLKLVQTGFYPVRIFPFDWLHPKTPVCAIPTVARLGRFLESQLIVREFAGSLLICAQRSE